MEKEKILEGNKLIAEFMDFHEIMLDEYSNYDLDDIYSILGITDRFKMLVIHENQLKFHSSWDWLMPVVEKIEELGYSFEKNYQRIDRDWQCLIVKGNDILFQEFNTSSILSAYYVVVEFIRWYNENK